jgi:peptidoglycan/LPS O-acetylase OafA/YrhL
MSAAARFEGLDAFRAVGIYGVVVIHFYQVMGLAWSPSIDLLIRLRDCAFPVVVLTSFFVLTRSLLRNPDRSFRQFVAGRFWRLEMPCVVWSALYWLMWGVLGPLAAGGRASWPPASLWLSGFVHLWFLQFLFVGSVVAYPLIRAIARRPGHRWLIAASCLAAAFAYGMWGRPYLLVPIEHGWINQADPSLRVATRQATVYTQYIPAAMAIALAADTITGLYERFRFRALSLGAVAATMAVHMSSSGPGFSRVLYSLAVFIALLQPWPRSAVAGLLPASRYAYPIYILHPAVAQVVLVPFLVWPRLTVSLASLVAGSVLVFVASGLLAAALRKVCPWDWFLPLVPVGTDIREADRAI